MGLTVYCVSQLSKSNGYEGSNKVRKNLFVIKC